MKQLLILKNFKDSYDVHEFLYGLTPFKSFTDELHSNYLLI